MVSQLVLLIPKTGMTDEEFHRYLTETHAELSKQLPGLKSYEIKRISALGKRII